MIIFNAQIRRRVDVDARIYGIIVGQDSHVQHFMNENTHKSHTIEAYMHAYVCAIDRITCGCDV